MKNARANFLSQLSCGDDDKGLMSRLAEMFMVDGYNQRKPVRVVAYEESETLQLYVDEANMTIKQVPLSTYYC